MPAFLSDAWIRELAAAAASARGLDAAETGLVVEQVVTGSPWGDVGYRLSIGATGAVITKRVADDDAGSEPNLVLVTDYETAGALHQGRLRAQDALAAGSLKVRGSPEALARAADALSVLDAAFAAVRPHTTFVADGARGGSTAEG